MKVFCHHIYEYKKGLRNLVLHTMHPSLRIDAQQKLEINNISFVIKEVSPTKINIFFGAPECVEVIKYFGNKKLSDYTPEEDFILGVMLGYCRKLQCNRYLDHVGQTVNKEIKIPVAQGGTTALDHFHP